MEMKKFNEKISHGTAMFPFAFYEWLGEFCYIVSLHRHKETEILYLEKGNFNFTNSIKNYLIQAPAFAFVEAEEIHSIVLEEHQQESALVFDLHMLYFENYDAIQAKIMKPLIDKIMKFPDFIFPKDQIWEQVVNIYQKIVFETRRGCIGSQVKIKAYLLELIAILYENDYMSRTGIIEEPITYKIENIKKVLDYIRKNYMNRIMVSSTAGLLGMNEQYFCRYFKKNTGKTLMEYINIVRIEKAAELLIKTDDKIIEIAIQCGYDNIGYFNRQFKNIKCMTPLEFRRISKEFKLS